MKALQIIKITTLFLWVLLCFWSCTTDKKVDEVYTTVFTIEGEIEGMEGNLYYRHPEREYSREHFADTLFIEGNKFKLIDSVSEPRLMRIFSRDSKTTYKTKEGGYYPSKSQWLVLFVYPGADIRVEGEISNFLDAYPKGDNYNDDLASINKIVYPLYNKGVMLYSELTFISDSLQREKLQISADSLYALAKEEQVKFIRKNPNSIAAHYYLEDMIMRRHIDDDQAMELYNDIPGNTQNFYYKSVETRINAISATKEGNPVPEINTIATLDGEKFDITSYEGKYVLIDFWGTWCAPCIEEMPQIKDLQEKYKNDLRVLGINSGDSKERIKTFTENHGYGWQQVLNDDGNTDDNFVRRFNVKGFPTKYIIDPEGKIVKSFLGSGEEAFELLETLINQNKSS